MKKQKKRREPFLLEKSIVAKSFGNMCFCCNRPYGEYFLFHHLWYEKNSITYKDHKPKLALEEVKSYPERFLLLCRPCHIHLEHYLNFPTTWENLKKAYDLSKQCRNISNYTSISKIS